MTNKVLFAIVALALSLALSSPEPARAPNPSDQEALQIATDAYVYAYPLVLMDVFMRQGTNYTEPTGIVTQAPYNQFSHARAFPPADFKAVVRPNVDTLYSSAILTLVLSQSCCRYRRQTATSCSLC